MGSQKSRTRQQLNNTTYMYVYPNHFVVHVRLTQHHKLTILQLKMDKIPTNSEKKINTYKKQLSCIAV